MSITILDWEAMINLTLNEKNSLYHKLNKKLRKEELSEPEQTFLNDLYDHLEDEYWECEYCRQYFCNDDQFIRYDPPTCDSCKEENISFFGISYQKADKDTKKLIKKSLEKEAQIDKGMGYYGL